MRRSSFKTQLEQNTFSKVVLVVDSDIGLRLLGESSTDGERQILGAILHQTNGCVLHHDKSLVQRDRKLWSSLNAISSNGEVALVTYTYVINNHQNFSKSAPDTFLTLNP